MLSRTTVMTWLLAAAAAGCQNSSQPDRAPADPYARPVESEPTVKVIRVERLGDAPEHPSTEVEAQARRFGTVTRRRALASRFDVRSRDASETSTGAPRSEPTSTPAWPPVDYRDGEGEGAAASSPSPVSETSSGNGTTTNTGVSSENP